MNYTNRQKRVIAFLLEEEASTADILKALQQKSIDISEDSLSRDLAELREAGLVESFNKGPARRHHLSALGRVMAPYSFEDFAIYLSSSREPVVYHHDRLMMLLTNDIFNSVERQELEALQTSFHDFMSNAPDTIKNRWYQKWLIEFAWKSSAIEGNTYDALETETLLLDHIEATGKTHAEAVMILNHQSAIRQVYEQKEAFLQPDISLFESVHGVLVKDLGVGGGIRSMGVGISGSVYRPLAIRQKIVEELAAVAVALPKQTVWSQALASVLAISYLQPFEDGNKRTARVVANGLLYAHDSIPLVLGTIEPTKYRRACLAFYELGNASLMKEIVLNSWRETAQEISQK